LWVFGGQTREKKTQKKRPGQNITGSEKVQKKQTRTRENLDVNRGKKKGKKKKPLAEKTEEMPRSGETIAGGSNTTGNGEKSPGERESKPETKEKGLRTEAKKKESISRREKGWEPKLKGNCNKKTPKPERRRNGEKLIEI